VPEGPGIAHESTEPHLDGLCRKRLQPQGIQRPIMKRSRLVTLLIGLWLVPALCSAEWHTFTSADGSKKLEAVVQDYNIDSGVATLRLKDNRKITAPATAFSEADQEHLEEIGLAFKLGRSLWVEFEDEESVVSEKRNPTNGYQTMELKNGYRLEVRNNGTVPFDGLIAEYQVFYGAYENPFKDNEKTPQVHRGKIDLPVLQPREETVVKTDLVNLTSIKRLPLKECVGGVVTRSGPNVPRFADRPDGRNYPACHFER